MINPHAIRAVAGRLWARDGGGCKFVAVDVVAEIFLHMDAKMAPMANRVLKRLKGMRLCVLRIGVLVDAVNSLTETADLARRHAERSRRERAAREGAEAMWAAVLEEQEADNSDVVDVEVFDLATARLCGLVVA